MARAPTDTYETREWNITVHGVRPYVQMAFAQPDKISAADLRRLFAVVDWLRANHVQFNTYYDGDIDALRRRAS